MSNLSCDILIKVGLIFGQHLEQQTQIQPPLLFGHSVPVMADKQTKLSKEYIKHKYSSLYKSVISTVIQFRSNTHSKSVCCFSSITGLNVNALPFRPNKHAVSGELANTTPDREDRLVSVVEILCELQYIYLKEFQIIVLPCLKVFDIFSVSHCTALTPIFVPKFLSKGEGAPPLKKKEKSIKQ